jgi:hypothetical protein
MPRHRNRNQNSKKGENERVGLSKQAKKKRLFLLHLHHAQVPEEEYLKRRKAWIKRTSLQIGTPEASEGIYPADASIKDRDSQTAYQHAAAVISPNAKPHSSEATLFVIHHTGVPPPTKVQLLQEEYLEKQNNHQLFLDSLLPIWHKDTFFLRGYQKSIAINLIKQLLML